MKIRHYEDYTANCRVRDVVPYNGHQNLYHKHRRAGPVYQCINSPSTRPPWARFIVISTFVNTLFCVEAAAMLLSVTRVERDDVVH